MKNPTRTPIINWHPIQGWRQLRQAMKTMTFKEKVQHIFYAYKMELCVMALMLFVVALIVSSVITANTVILLSGDLMNVNLTDEGMKYVQEDYLASIGGAGFMQKYQVLEAYYSLNEESGQYDYNYDTSMKTLSLVAAGDLDFQLIDKGVLELFLSEQIYLDLRNFLSEEELKQWEGKILYLEYAETGERVPVALDMSETAFVKDCAELKTHNYFFAVIKTSPRVKETKAFFDYLMAWQPKEQPTTTGGK